MRKSILLSSLAILIIINSVLYYLAVNQDNHALYSENGVMEGLQAVIALTAGLIAFFYQSKIINSLKLQDTSLLSWAWEFF